MMAAVSGSMGQCQLLIEELLPKVVRHHQARLLYHLGRCYRVALRYDEALRSFELSAPLMLEAYG